MQPVKVVRAAELPVAQLIINQVRQAYLASPGAMPISSITLDPLEVIVIDGQTSQYYRVPVTVNSDGSLAFGSPVPNPGPVSPNAYPNPPGTVQPNVPGGSPTLPAPTFSNASRGAGTAGVAASKDDAEYRALFVAPPRDDPPAPDYDRLFTTRETAHRMLDQQDANARHAIQSLTDDQVYARLYGQGGSR
jgi:hypothetical protein